MRLTFDLKWRQPYESSWCTHEKIKFANECTGTEYLKLLHIVDKNKTNQILPDALSKSIDAINKLESFLEISFNNAYLQDIKNILGPLYQYNDIDRYFAGYLRFCPICISKGYHSIYHQLLFNQYCPFHNQLLETKSYNFPLGITQRKTDFGFNFIFNRYFGDYSAINIFTEWMMNKRLYLTSHKNNYLDRCWLYFFPFMLNNIPNNIKLFTAKSEHFNRIIQLSAHDFLMCGRVVNHAYSSGNIIDTDEDVQIRMLSELYFFLYKSIAKHLRKSSTNITIVLKALHDKMPIQRRKIKKQLTDEGRLNPEVAAYILWNRDIGGHKFYHHVDYIQPTISTLHQSIYYQYMLDEFYRYKKLYPDMPINIFMSIMQYALSMIFWAQYKHYVEWGYTELALKNKKTIDLDYTGIGDMPLVVVWNNPKTDIYYMLKM